MKHIKKKFLNQVSISQEINELLDKEIGAKKIDISKQKIPKGFVPFFTTYDNLLYSAFQVKIGSKTRIIPEPDPILVYFHTAYSNYKSIPEVKNKLIEQTETTLGTEPAINELYEYFGLVSSYVIFLFTAIESTMNRCIPKDYIHTAILTNKTEIHSKEQIERNFSFERKLKVLNEITGKNFEKNYKMKYQHLINLKNFRDDIIHTKSVNQGETAVNHNYRRAFNFDYENTIKAVKDFCNYYIGKDLIVDCDCSKDW